jgi:two-component system chemotaxis response regulator CheY
LESIEKNSPFDLICLDIMMPIMDGQTALKRIRAIEIEKKIPVENHIKVIMTTALDDPTNIRDSYVDGNATSYITKPVNILMLKQLLQQLGFTL